MVKKQPKDWNKPKHDRQKEKAYFRKVQKMDSQARQHMQEIGACVR